MQREDVEWVRGPVPHEAAVFDADEVEFLQLGGGRGYYPSPDTLLERMDDWVGPVNLAAAARAVPLRIASMWGYFPEDNAKDVRQVRLYFCKWGAPRPRKLVPCLAAIDLWPTKGLYQIDACGDVWQALRACQYVG